MGESNVARIKYFRKFFLYLCLTALVPTYLLANDNHEPFIELKDTDRLLFYAQNGNLAETDRLLKKGVPVDSPDTHEHNSGETPLMKAVLNGDTRMVKLLLQYGADINALDKQGESALLVAAYMGDEKMVRYLVNQGARLKTRSAKGVTPLLTAADQGHFNLVRFFLEKGASVHEKTNNGFTTVMASSKYHPDIMEFLLDKGVDPNARTDYGGTALMVAAKAGNKRSVEILLQHGALVNYTTKQGKNPFLHATDGWGEYFQGEDNRTTIWSLLLEACLEQKGCTTGEVNPIHSLLEILYDEKYLPEQKLITSLFADKKTINKKNRDGFTPLDIALFIETSKKWTPHENNTTATNNKDESEPITTLIIKLREAGATLTIPESYLTLNRIGAEKNWKKLKSFYIQEGKTFNWKNYIKYRKSSELYSRYSRSGTYVFEKQLYQLGYWDKKRFFDTDELESACKKNNTEPFDHNLSTTDTSYYGPTADTIGTLTNKCPLTFTEQFLNQYADKNPVKVKQLQLFIYQYLHNAIGQSWGVNRSGLAVLLDFLVKTGYRSDKHDLLIKQLSNTKAFYYNYIRQIENVVGPLDNNGNTIFHYLLAEKKRDYPYNLYIDIAHPKKYFNIELYRMYDKIIKESSKFDQPNKNGITPLMVACRNGMVSMVRDLLSRGADPDRKDNNGLSAIDYAVFSNQWALVDLIASEKQQTESKIKNSNNNCRLERQSIPDSYAG